ncbi:hypothetical protein CN384_07660 [Bacillus thuringiensis]|uniref:hypothetical protein n=1 Tax=Bacillus cereus group TaxID=86661 RepID=UPI000BF4AF67|nr:MULTISPECIES: hypothetical protein [Bacillus cereus group]PES55161.1 hypothetical protein CN515_03635 [Bacillus cereus]PFA29562.1 hypothetical protein CN384_07660 [Bacillus thuringiensis]
MITYTQDYQIMKEKVSGDILKNLKNMEHRILYLNNDVPIAYGEAIFEEDGSVYIEYIQCIEKRKGHGRDIINHLKNQETVTEIWGEAIPDAVPFWHRMGVKFEQSAFNYFIDEDELEEGFLVPFTLKCS